MDVLLLLIKNIPNHLCRFQATKPHYEKFSFLSDQPLPKSARPSPKAASHSSLDAPTFHVDSALSAGVVDERSRGPEGNEAAGASSASGPASRTPSAAHQREGTERRFEGSGSNATASGVVRTLLHHMRIALLALDAVLFTIRVAAILHVLNQLWHGLPVLGAHNPDASLRLPPGTHTCTF